VAPIATLVDHAEHIRAAGPFVAFQLVRQLRARGSEEAVRPFRLLGHEFDIAISTPSQLRLVLGAADRTPPQ
jgi:hypothetical protein